VGKPDVRNFRGGIGNRVKANLNGHEAGNGGYSQEEPEATTPVFYSTRIPICKEILVLQRTIENLRATRDLLLPKLVLGEIDVSDLDIAIREQENSV